MVVLAIYTTAPIERRTLKTLDVKRKGSWLLRTYCKGSLPLLGDGDGRLWR